jgi:hypothetical protein
MSRKETAETVINTLENAVRGRQVLVLGSPGSGKTNFLDQLREDLSLRHRSWIAFTAGPASSLLSSTFFVNLVDFLKREGCLNPQFDLPDRSFSLTGFFEKVSPALYKEMIRHLVILVDDLDQNRMPLDQISNLLSSVRGFYTEWRDIDINVHFVFAGQVNPRALLGLYRDADSASWPLEQGKTIFHLPPLTLDEVNEKINKSRGSSGVKVGLYSRYLFELSNGDVFTIARILSNLSNKNLSCQLFFDTAEMLVDSADWIHILDLRVRDLSARAFDVLVRNLQGQFVCLSDQELREELFLSGLFRETQFNSVYLINPVVERSLRQNWSDIKPKDAPDVFGNLSELIPPVFCLNSTAFELLSEIEMLLRNLVVVRLGIRTKQKHLLSGLNYEINPRTDLKEDQYFRSSDWRSQVGKSHFVDAHAALISYTDTKDLLRLLDHLIETKDEVISSLKSLRPQLSGMKDIRDAVMHGQIINEKSVENLYLIYSQLTTGLTIKI